MNGMPMGGGSREGGSSSGLNLRRASELFSWLFEITGCKAGIAIYIVLIGSAMSLLTILVPSVIGRVIDSFGNPAQSTRFIVLLLTLNVLIAVLGNRQGIAIPRLTQRMAYRLRHLLHAKLLQLPISYVDAHSHGDLMCRLTNDSENIVQSLSQAIPGMVSSLITLLGCVFIMLRISQTIALLNLGVGIVALLPCSLLSRSIFSASIRQQQALGALNAEVTDHITRRRSILCYDSSDHSCRQVARASGEFARATERTQILAGLMEPMMSLIGSVTFVLTIIIGIVQINRGAMMAGILQACLIYARQILRPFIDAGRTFSQIQGCLASAERLREIMNAPVDRDEGSQSILTFEVRGDIEFRDVCFSYLRGRPLYKGLNLSIPAGKTTAIIGETGAGKTSLFNLLLRFYQPDSGEILIDGIPVSKWTKRRLYGSISVILQDHVDTADTVLDSITYGSPGASREEALAAAQAVHAEEVIATLPQGLETPMTDDGILSLGQQQLIALARVPLSSARIILLDEATSSVDSYSESLFQKALEQLRDGRTCVIIAHRLSTIRNADHIIVMKDGRMIECGTHEALLAHRGYYWDIVQKHTRSIRE